MIKLYKALILREIWEHRAIYLTPAAIGVLVVLGTLTGQVTASAFGAASEMALVALGELGDAERRFALSAVLISLAGTFVFAMWVLAVFYTLDSLYAERKDKSILFWRSLPVTDAETVLSKLLVAVLVIPAFTLIGIMVTHLVTLIVTSFWLKVEGGSPWHLVWSEVPLFDTWTAIFITLVCGMIWLSPFIGWFLLASAYVKRSPLLLSFMPIAVLPMLERIALGSTLLADWFFVRPVRLPLFTIGDLDVDIDDIGDVVTAESVGLLDLIDLGKFLTDPGVYGGLIVCAAFTAGAIWIRRYRDDS